MSSPLRHIGSQARSVGSRPAAATLSEVFAGPGGEGAAAGFVLAQLGGRQGRAPVLWLQDRLSAKEAGRPYLPGMGGDLLLMTLSRPVDVLAAAEEGLRCATLRAVVAEVWGDPPVLDFLATKRLALRAEASGLACWLIRHSGRADLSAARDRWRIAALPSAPHPDDARAPGAARWRAELFRSRDRRPGLWVAGHDRAADRLDLVAAVPDGALAEGADARGRRTAR